VALWAILGLLAVALGTLAYGPEVEPGDGAEFMALGRALANHQGYRYACFPDQRLAKERIIGYPAILALCDRGPLDPVLVAKALGVLCFGIAAVLACLLLQSVDNPWLKTGAVLAFVLSPTAISHASKIGSDIPYMAPAFAALLLADVALRETRTGRGNALAGLAGVAIAAACYMRPTALALFPAMLVFSLLRRKPVVGLIAVCVAAALFAPWLWYSSTVKTERSYVEHFAVALGGERASAAERLYRAGALVRMNLIRQPRAMVDAVLCLPSLGNREQTAGDEAGTAPAKEAISPDAIDWGDRDFWLTVDIPLRLSPQRVVKYALFATLLWGLVLSARRWPTTAHFYVLMTWAYLVFDMHAAEPRISLHLMPFLGLYLLTGVGDICRRMARRVADHLLPAAVVMVLALAAIQSVSPIRDQVAQNLAARGLAWSAPERYTVYGPDMVAYIAAAHWYAESAPQDAVLVCRRPFVPYLISGRLSTWEPIRDTASPAACWEMIRSYAASRPTYIIQSSRVFDDRWGAHLLSTIVEPVLAQHADEVARVAEFGGSGERTIVWQVIPRSPSSAGVSPSAS
jgi:hypothetical protein